MATNELDAMGISKELADKVVEAIRADAAASPTGMAKTARVVAALKAMGFDDAHEPAIRILAGSIGIKMEGAGRPPGIRTLYSPLRAKVRDLKAQGHGVSDIARRLRTSRANVYKLLDTDDNEN